MDDLKFTVLGKSFRVCRKPSGVPTVVTREFAGQIAWGLSGEWAQVLDSVWPYHGLPEETCLAAVFLMETRPFPKSSEPDGAVFTAWPVKGEDRAMVEAAIVELGWFESRRLC